MLKIHNTIDKTFEFRYMGLGDVWAATNYLLRHIQEPRLVRNYWSGLALQIQDLLDTDNKIVVTDESANARFDILECFGCRYFRTKAKWTGGSGVLCYQFDGMSQMNLKNLLPEDERRLLLHLGSRYRLINVGGKRPIAEVVEDLAGSDGFVGVPSGISHIANSVGVPNVVILTDKILEYHRGFDNYKNMVYWNKPNMVFYAGVGALMGDHEFIRDFPLRKRELIT